MRILIQRVESASVIADGKPVGKIGKGLLLFAGFEDSDTQTELEYAVKKCLNLRIFDDCNGVMNLSVAEISGEILLISQFTLHAQTKKGNRPSYIKAAKPQTAIPLYNSFAGMLGDALGREIQTGIFGADMKVTLVNDGPVTIWIDTNEKT